MNPLFTTSCAFFLLVSPSFSQTDAPQRDGTKSLRDIQIPLPLASPRAVRFPAPALTPREKASVAFKNIFYPRALAGMVLLSGFDQLRTQPEEWGGGAEGYGLRLGSRVGQRAVRNAIQLAGDVAFRTENRYDFCACTRFMPRLGHAWKRVIVAHKDDGGDTVAFARITSSIATPWVTHNWFPDRLNTTGRKFSSGSANLALRGVSNMVSEFWPDISRTLRLPRMFRKR